MWYALGREEIDTVLVEKREEKRPHGRPRHKWEGIIKLDFNK